MGQTTRFPQPALTGGFFVRCSMTRRINAEGLRLVKQWSSPAAEQECWLFKGKSLVKSGNGACTYGRVVIKGKTKRAHRMAWEACCGPIPSGMLVCHSCDTPLCINPSHLFLGTAADNNRDKMMKGRHRAAKGERNGQAKLTDVEALELKRLALAGHPYRGLAARYGVSRALVSLIKNGKARAWCAA